MKIKTDVLRNALDFLSWGVAKSKDKYETELIEFETSNGRLKAYTSDDVNKLGIRICDTDADFNVLLKFDMLYNLVKACTDDEIELKAAKNYTTFTTKTVSCRLSTFNTTTSNKKPCFPKYTSKMNGSKIKEHIPTLKSILDVNHVEECYRYVYFSDNIMVSDTDNVLIVNENLFNNILLSLKDLEILSTFDDFDYILNDTTLCAHCNGKIIEFPLMNKTKYQYADMLELFNTVSKNTVTLDKSILRSAISTASLFDEEKVNLVFDENGIRLEIPSIAFKYDIMSKRCIDQTYSLPLTLLRKFLVLGDELTIGYDDPSLIYVESGKIKAIYGVPSND